MARPKSATVDIKIRMKEPLRKEIETAADEKGNSMNAEMVARLEQSFSGESVIVRAFGDERSYRLARLLFGTKDVIEAMHGRSIFDDLETFRAAHTAMCALMERFAPAPGADLKKKTTKALREREEYLASMRDMKNQLAVMAQRPLTPEEQAQAEGYRTAKLVFSGKRETKFDED